MEHVAWAQKQAASIAKKLATLPLAEQVETLNALRAALSAAGPFCGEPVDCIQWIAAEKVGANDYNPNSVAPPEMKLLEHSIISDGYTQPVVTWVKDDGERETVDGFHRGQVGRTSEPVRLRTQGYLPVTTVNIDRTDRGDRMASTIRHNRARGKHSVSGMSDIVLDLSRRNWSDTKIAKELGMEPDEVLRLKQITGLADLFSGREFSEAWEAE